MRIISYLDNFFEERVGGIINFHKYNFVLKRLQNCYISKNCKTNNFETVKIIAISSSYFLINDLLAILQKTHVINIAKFFYVLIEHELAYFSESGLAEENIFCNNHIQCKLLCCHSKVFIKKMRGAIRTWHMLILKVFVQTVSTHIPELANAHLNKFY